MLPVLLIGGTLGFRALGACGVRRFASWSAGAAHAMAVVLAVTASAHFVPADVTVMPNHADLVAMVPPAVPLPSAMVYLTGVLEVMGGVGLVLSRTRRAAAIALVALFVMLLPANVYAALENVPFAGDAPTPLVQRIPEQLLYIAVAAWIAWATRTRIEAPTRSEMAVVR